MQVSVDQSLLNFINSRPELSYQINS